MKKRMELTLLDAWKNRDKDLDLKNYKDVLILASLVEKETSLNYEKSNVAQVFLNRLRLNMKLQSDPTVIYGIEKELNNDIKELKKRDLDFKSEFNSGWAVTAAKRDLCSGCDVNHDFTKTIFDSYLEGRALIYNQAPLDEILAQRDIILNEWEKVVAAVSIHYVNDVAADIEALIAAGSAVSPTDAAAADYENQLEMHRNNADALRNSYQTLEDKIDEIKRKKGILSVKQKQAEAQENIYQTMEGLGNTSGTMETIARIEEKVENMQTRAEAYQEISMESDKDSLESKFEELEHDSSDMELELLELKKRAALPAPDEESDKKE